MNLVLRKLIAIIALHRRARIEVWNLLAALMETGMSIEEALATAIASAQDQDQSLRARVLRHWQQALLEDRFATEAASWLPSTEAMVLHAHGLVDLQPLCAAAARIAEARARQVAAVTKALAIPTLLGACTILLLWAAGWEFIPTLTQVSPPSTWPVSAKIFAGMSTWTYENIIVLIAAITAFFALIAAITLMWTGPGRVVLDRFMPFSLYRLLSGSAFLFVALEFLRAGVDLNDATFRRFQRSASRYTRHRLAAIQSAMATGAGLGSAMRQTGHRFPDPSLIAVIAALETTPGFERRLAGFVDRWVENSDELMQRRTAVVNVLLLMLVTGIVGVGVQGMYGMMATAGGL